MKASVNAKVFFLGKILSLFYSNNAINVAIKRIHGTFCQPRVPSFCPFLKIKPICVGEKVILFKCTAIFTIGIF